MNVWITSDQHWGHSNIIKYTGRPYNDVHEMDADLIAKWNALVGKEDIVWHLGDFCMGDKERVRHYVSQLNGRVRLIKGNHDRYSANEYMNLGFDWCSGYPIIAFKYLILCHEPQFMPPNSIMGCVHGHIHQNTQGPSNAYFNVCVEHHDYSPVNLKDVEKHFRDANNQGEEF